MRIRRIKQIAAMCGILLLIVAILAGMTWREMHRQHLNRDLIAAVKDNDERKVIDLLDRGADANTHDDPPRTVSVWQLLLDLLRRRKNAPTTAPSALQIAFDWRPDNDAKIKPTIQDTPLIAALLKHGAKMGGREILSRLSRTYAFCLSYHDSGSLTTTAYNEPYKLTFHTAFVRPDRFYFEYDRFPQERYVIWGSTDKVRTWWTNQHGVTMRPFNLAIGAATGVSMGAAAVTPALLLPDLMGGWGGLPIIDTTQVVLHGTTIINGAPCYDLRLHESGSPIDSVTAVFVDTKSFLVRKIVEGYQSGSEAVTTFQPEVDVPISDNTFHFKPAK